MVLGLLGLAAVAYRSVSPGTADPAIDLTELPGGRIEFLPDPTGALTQADVSAEGVADRIRWQPLDQAAFARRGFYWLRLTIPNLAAREAEGVLEFTDQ